jgi:hypothetical protein
MDWELTINNNFIEISTRGIADKERSIVMAKAITDVMKKNRMKRVLIDHSQLKSVTGNVFEIYERPKIIKIIGAVLGIRIAEIVKIDHREHFKFLETVCINQGFQFQIFFKRDQAIKWLLS